MNRRLLNNIRESDQSTQLYRQILIALIPEHQVDRIVNASEWDVSRDCWSIPRITLPSKFPKLHIHDRKAPAARTQVRIDGNRV